MISILPIGTNPVVTMEMSIRAAATFLPPFSRCGPAEKIKVKVDDRKKMQFISDQNPIIKGESTARELGVDHMSYFLGLYPAYLPEMPHFFLRMADYYSSPPIAAYWYYIQNCHVILPKHTACGICHLKFSESEMPEVSPDMVLS